MECEEREKDWLLSCVQHHVAKAGLGEQSWYMKAKDWEMHRGYGSIRASDAQNFQSFQSLATQLFFWMWDLPPLSWK